MLSNLKNKMTSDFHFYSPNLWFHFIRIIIMHINISLNVQVITKLNSNYYAKVYSYGLLISISFWAKKFNINLTSWLKMQVNVLIKTNLITLSGSWPGPVDSRGWGALWRNTERREIRYTSSEIEIQKLTEHTFLVGVFHLVFKD